jgi:hypothetical protein
MTCVQAPSSEAGLTRGGVEASSGVGSARGSVYPSSEVDPARGASAVPPGRVAGAAQVVIVPCVCFRFVG